MTNNTTFTENKDKDHLPAKRLYRGFSIFSHPDSNCMSYFQHFRLSLHFSKKMFISSWKALIHAIIPSLFITSTSDTVSDIQDTILKNSCTEHYN